MPYECYVPKRFNRRSEGLIEFANQVIEEYQAEGFDLTLRQLYYQMVARDVIPNSVQSYNNFGNLISDARLAGLVDWLAIEDRTRNLRKNAHWTSPREILNACASQFAIDKWANQDYRVEVWIEKDALVGVISGVCSELDVPYFACRGYNSQSEMWRAAKRLEGYEKEGQTTVILHLGDHDPSGMDMTRDIEERLRLFMGGTEVERLALNMDQVKKHKPPPNPAKIADPRAGVYITRFGQSSWELDALEPREIARLITQATLSYRDEDKWAESIEKENGYQQKLKKLAIRNYD